MNKTEILNKVNEMLNDIDDVKETRISFNDIEDKILLRSSINNILKESKNDNLNMFLNNILNDLASGKTESMLYEAFISGASNWNYLNAVDTELSAISSRIDKYKQDIDLSKIVNTMKNTTSAYIVPLIEECVLDYINDKTSNNRVILTDRLMAFHYDPFVKDILNVLHYDRSISESFNYNSQVENNVTIEKVYSPVYSVSESESIFNINGTFYTKKGNNISRITKSEAKKLDESFINLCNIINSDNVRINENEDLELSYNGKRAIISESCVYIDNNKMTNDQINEAKSISFVTNDGYVNFYNVVQYLVENYNSIAHIDFAKHVKSNKNDNTFDFFKLKESYYLTTHDSIGHHTFYRNINPIQTVHIINEHMDMNVSNLFEELQPDQKKIQHEIDETRKSYEDYINELEERKAKLESCKEDASSEDAGDIEEALKIVEDELEKVKNDYKEYQKTSDDFLTGGEGEDDSDIPSDDDNDNTDDFSDDSNDELDNSSSDVETPILSVTGDMNGDNIVDYDPYFDETPAQEVEDVYAPKVVKVSYQSNIKTGQVTNSGEVHILIPSVNSNGDVTNELQRITFSLDGERNPIINNEYMPVAIYNIIKDAIEAEPMTAEVDVEAVMDEPVNIDASVDNQLNYAAPEQTGEENPIDSIYGTEDIVTDNPEAEPNDVRDLINADEVPNDNIEDEDIVEPTATTDEEPMDLEANTKVSSLISFNISEDDLLSEDISPEKLHRYLMKQGIISSLENGVLNISIRNSEECDKLERYFVDFMGWPRDEFYTYCSELKMYESYKPSKVVVKYSSKLENILENNNLSYKISKRGDKMMIMNAINEGVLITVTDDKTGKTIKINTDELNDNTEAEDHEENTQDDVTFDDSENANTADSDDNASDDNASDNNSDDDKNESTENRPEAKKKFTFRIKKQKTDESLGITEYENKLNEAHETPEVMDTVKYKGKTGHVISKLSNGEIIVEVGGHTEMIRPSQIKIVNTDFVKADDLNESVKCGIFMNGYCITPDNCVTDVAKYNKATDDEMVTLVIEGVAQEIAKKYTKILS